MNVLLELLGFALIVAAAAYVAIPLALLVAGVLLVAVANRPQSPPSPAEAALPDEPVVSR